MPVHNLMINVPTPLSQECSFKTAVEMATIVAGADQDQAKWVLTQDRGPARGEGVYEVSCEERRNRGGDHMIYNCGFLASKAAGGEDIAAFVKGEMLDYPVAS